MVSSFIGTISGLFDKRFLVTAWLPVFCFGAAGVILYAAGTGPDVAIATWDGWPPLKQLWASAGAQSTTSIVSVAKIVPSHRNASSPVRPRVFRRKLLYPLREL